MRNNLPPSKCDGKSSNQNKGNYSNK
jgi:hypothetical protein